jgi:hypothetical protein
MLADSSASLHWSAPNCEPLQRAAHDVPVADPTSLLFTMPVPALGVQLEPRRWRSKSSRAGSCALTDASSRAKNAKPGDEERTVIVILVLG